MCPTALVLGVVQVLGKGNQLEVEHDPLARSPRVLSRRVLLQQVRAHGEYLRAHFQVLDAVEAEGADGLPQPALGHHVPLLAQVQVKRLNLAGSGRFILVRPVAQLYHAVRGHSDYQLLVGRGAARLVAGAEHSDVRVKIVAVGAA